MRRLLCLIGIHSTSVRVVGRAARCSACGDLRAFYKNGVWQRPRRA